LGWVFNFGLQGTAVMAILGIVLTPVLFMLTPNFTRKKNTTNLNTASNKQGFELNKAFTGFAIISLLLVMSVRAWTQSSVSSFVPLFFTQEGSFTVAQASRISFLVSIGIMVGSLASGFIADRVGGRIVIFLAFLATAPMTFLLFWPKGSGAELIAPILGFAAGAGWPPMLVMSQELLPKNAGVASGLSLGFVFAMGGVGTWITGILAEPYRLGLYNSMVWLSVLPVIAAFLTLALPTQEAITQAARASLEPSMSTQAVESASD
jgi:FSR family fosmidomycin resistance protein-like MFS transporter